MATTFLPSHDSVSVTIASPPPPPDIDVSTQTGLNAISGTPEAGQAFIVSGFVIRRDNGSGLGGVPVRISVNGSTVATINTRDVDGFRGDFNTDITIAEAGSYTVRADFDGMTRSGVTFGSSSGSTVLGIDMDGVIGALPVIIGAAVLGIILVR